MKLQFYLQFLTETTAPSFYLFCFRLIDCQRWKSYYFPYGRYEVRQYAKIGGEGGERETLLIKVDQLQNLLGPVQNENVGPPVQ